MTTPLQPELTSPALLLKMQSAAPPEPITIPAPPDQVHRCPERAFGKERESTQGLILLLFKTRLFNKDSRVSWDLQLLGDLPTAETRMAAFSSTPFFFYVCTAFTSLFILHPLL